MLYSFEREGNIVSENYLNSNLKEIEDNKKLVNTCKKCMELRLPEYNMGFNKHLWEEIAKKILNRYMIIHGFVK